MLWPVATVAFVAASAMTGSAETSADTGAAPSGTTFDHPSGWHTKHDIVRIRAQIASGQEPWSTAFKALMAKDAVGPGDATLDYKPTPGAVVCRDCGPAPPGAPPWDAHNETGNGPFSQDARTAYYLMVKWIVTNNTSYADAAESVIDAWSAQLTEWAGFAQMLSAGIYGGHMAQAAELLAFAKPRWPFKARAQRMFLNVIHPACSLFCGRTSNSPPQPKPQTCEKGANGNWDAVCMSGVASWAVFLDNKTMLNTVLDYYKTGRGNGRLTHYIYESGQCQESGRDQGHTQLGISGLTQTALTLYHALNSTEPFTYANYRLRKGLEYTAKYNLGYEVPFQPNGGCNSAGGCCNCTSCPKVYDGDWCFLAISNRSGHDAMWEMAAAIYGDTAPFTQEVVNAGHCERYSPTVHYATAYCDSHGSVCRPSPPNGEFSRSKCINATEHPGGGNESYRPEMALESGPGFGTLLFHGMPLPNFNEVASSRE